MNKYKKILALFMVAVMSVVTFGQTGMTALAATTDTDANEEISLYDKDVRTDLDEDEVAKAEDINVIVDSDFDVTNVKDGISYDDTKVSVAYVEDMGDFNLSKAGKYDTYYLVDPYS